MTEQEMREAARQFYYKWKDKGSEKQDDQSYWLDLLQKVFGITDATDRTEFQKPVPDEHGVSNWIDVYIPETKVLIEQKSIGIDLSKPQAGHNGKTPYEQAKSYDNGLPYDEKSRWIITSNFAEIRIYDMNQKKPEPVKLMLSELPDKFHILDFLLNKKQKKITEEIQLSIKAGELIGKIHDRFLEQYHDPMAKKTQNSLNILCVRLVFCLYAEDAGLLGAKDAFSKYIQETEPKNIRRALLDLFKVLDTPLDQREELYLDDELASFPYVNGGLFKRENIEIPLITQEIKDTIIESAEFNWSKISPTIFGAVFESTLNPETRRSGGMHYTSIENIHKVIDPLFLDDLKAEFAEIEKISVFNTKKRKLEAFQNKLASLTFLDPACGSGNFLTETYLSLRRLENKVIADLNHGRMQIGWVEDDNNPIKVSITQFYGIEINDFAVTVAKTALWIAESQMFKETEDILFMQMDFLPLKTNANIVEGNALSSDTNWNRIVPKDQLSYILGNPPFVGARWMSPEQKKDISRIFNGWKNIGDLDYVCCWYKLISDYIRNTNIRAALVSTNSITQGESVCNLWEPLLTDGIIINFAYRTFIWDSEANEKAHVHCVIIGFSRRENADKFIDEGGVKAYVSHISGYLTDTEDIFVEKRSHPISNVPEMCLGGQAIDNGNFVLKAEEKEELLKKEPQAATLIRRYMMGKDFIDRKPRYCLWMKDADPAIISKCPEVMKRIKAVEAFRSSSKRSSTLRSAETPSLFAQAVEFKTPYVAIPKVSSQNRRYVPMDFLSQNIIPGDKLFCMSNATLYHFGILMSNVHMAWMRVVCGRLKSDYSYSNTIVYNNFPWPSPTNEQKAKIEQTAQDILDARTLYPDSSLADLYNPLTMPPELRKAHQKNDAAVMQAYGFNIKTMSEADCVAELMKMYQRLVQQEGK